MRVGTILNPNSLGALEERLAALEADTVLGGLVDRDSGVRRPTVIVRPLSEHDELMEFFAPMFYILVYENDAELAAFFNRREYLDNAMYVSLYGQRPVEGLFESSTVLFNHTVLRGGAGQHRVRRQRREGQLHRHRDRTKSDRPPDDRGAGRLPAAPRRDRGAEQCLHEHLVDDCCSATRPARERRDRAPHPAMPLCR